MASTEQEKRGNNPEGKGGFGDNPQNINPGGRPKNSLKSYVAKKLADMSDEEKDAFLKSIDPKFQWAMGEGNPPQNTDITSKGESINPILVKFIDGNTDHTNPDGV